MSSRKRFNTTTPAPNPPKASKLSYRVIRNSCFHAGIEYKQGDIMPELPLAALNVHLPNLELVEVEEIHVDLEPETAITIIDQETSDPSDYYV